VTTNSAQEDTKYLPEHAPRVDWMKLVPEVHKAMIRLDTAVRKSVETTLLNPVKIRASQINHCTFCLDLHSKDALAAGESAERIIQLNAWTESKHFYRAKEIGSVSAARSLCRPTRSCRSNSPRCGWRAANGSAACAPPPSCRLQA